MTIMEKAAVVFGSIAILTVVWGYVKKVLGMPERPGRVDRVVHFAELDDDRREKMAKRILKDCLPEVAAQVALGRDDTAAQFQERCFRIALRHKFHVYKTGKANGRNGHTEVGYGG
jgi:hypothetical protein